LIVTAGYSGTLSNYDRKNCYQYPDCLKTVDIMWRIIIGFGALLPAIALGFRLSILESPRYTADVLKKGAKAAAQLGAMAVKPSMQTDFSSDEGSSNNESRVQLPAHMTSDNGGGVGGNPVGSRAVEDDQIRPAPNDVQHEMAPSNDRVTRSVTSPAENGVVRAGVMVSEEEMPSQLGGLRADIKRYFLTQGHGWTLFATSLCWLCVDLPFYGLGMNSTSIIGQIWLDTSLPAPQLDSLLLSNAWESLIFVSIGALTGGLVTFFTINVLGERMIQMIGFSALFILFILTGGLLNHLMKAGHDHFIVFLYVMCQTFFNFGEFQL
jgi:PHS family inorganic phosphate transporter-like MFS transporter